MLRIARWLILAALPVGAVTAAEDVPGSRDPLGIERFPDSWIVAYQLDERPRSHIFVLGRLSRIRRDLRVEHEVRAASTLERVTYEMPAGTLREEVIAHYQERIGGERLFSCRGRDCGRSNLWANEVFKEAVLYGPDANQFYFAGEYRDHLLALYVIERGNRRIYAHLEVLKPMQEVALGATEQILERLAGDGLALVEGVVPSRDGGLPAEGRTLLNELANGLGSFQGQTIYVVCHLYGQQSAEELLERSARCAGSAVAELDREGGPELVPFAAGPLLPRTGAGARLELVLPHRLSH